MCKIYPYEVSKYLYLSFRYFNTIFLPKTFIIYIFSKPYFASSCVIP